MNKLSFLIWAVLVVTFTGGAILLHEDFHANLTKVNAEILADTVAAELPTTEPAQEPVITIPVYNIPELVIVAKVPEGYARRRK